MDEKLNRKVIAHSELFIGMLVQDEDGDVGTVKECGDIHNVIVEYEGGLGLYCLLEGCTEEVEMIVDGKIAIIPHYDPLYHCESDDIKKY